MRRLLATSTVAVVCVAMAWAVGLFDGRGTVHRLQFTTERATNLFAGLQLRAAGQVIGTVADVRLTENGHRVTVGLEIQDERAWPLPVDTVFTARFGGTVIYSGRYVEVTPGRSSTTLADGAIVPDTGVRMPVEVDDVAGSFDAPTRQNLRATVDATSATLGDAARPLRTTIERLPSTLEQAEGLFRDLGAEPETLTGLLRTTHRVLASANAARPDVASLVTDAATTFRATGDEAAALAAALEQAPATLRRARSAFPAIEQTLDKALRLTNALDPGLDEVRRISGPLERLLRRVRTVSPDVTRTLATLRHATPDLDRALTSVAAVSPELASVAEQASGQLRCIRPFSPEIAAFASTWSGFVSQGDYKDKYARLFFGSYPFPNSTPIGVPAAAQLLPSAFASWGLPRAPGANAGQPWYQPECGVTAEGADPQKAPDGVDGLSISLVPDDARRGK